MVKTDELTKKNYIKITELLAAVCLKIDNK